MRPLHLTMTAFGSYAGETSVDFERMTGGLYLIVGRTGAGKTTIFDAISFALFGKPSGSERTADMLHSDFVSKSVDTVARLTFLHQGRRYTVERTIHFMKKRGTADEYGDGRVDARMWQEDGEPLTGASRVTARCEELLGLNAEQFRRIVMLAQGEFREFLRSDSNRKNEILGRLFDNTDYVRYQNLLCGVRDTLRKRRSEQENSLRTVMNTLFRLPEDADTEDYLPGHPHLKENLSALIAREEERQAELDRQYRDCAAAEEELSRREAAAATDNRLLTELEQREAHREELLLRKEAVRAMQAEYAAAERAVRRVTPKLRELEHAESSLRDTETAVAGLEETLLQQSGERKLLGERVEADAPKAERLRELQMEERQLTERLPLYEDLSVKEKDLTEAGRDLAAVTESLATAKKKKDAYSERIGAIRVELERLEGADAEVVRCQTALRQAEDRQAVLIKPGTGILDRTAGILRDEAALAADETKLAALTKDAMGAEDRYHAVYRAFIAGQSGIMAELMRRELRESGRTVCPVCRTPFRTGDPADFAALARETPSQDDVEAAESARKRAEEDRQALHSDMENRRAVLEQYRRSALQDILTLDGNCVSWETLSAPGYLPALRERLDREADEAGELHWKAVSGRDTRDRLSAERDGLEAELKELESQILTQTERRTELELRITGLRSAAEERRRQLPFPDAAQAQKRIAELRAGAESLSSELSAHLSELRAAEERCAKTDGALRSRRDMLPGLTDALTAAGDALSQALADSLFHDLDEYRAALSPLGGQEAESWLDARRSELDTYANDVDNTEQRIARLRELTAGKTMADLEQLEAELGACRGRREAADEARRAQSALLANHRDVCGRVEETLAGLAGTGAAYMRIERLAALAEGVSSEGGRLSFDRYVMGTIFREVLDMANRRLNVMTGGQFELVHSTDAGRRNASAGLEIEILDVAKGTRRSSASVSGGEGFMVSLALALGLSDVVQNHAGGRKLDTLFIDEGFGSLDDGRLDSVITVLRDLTEGNRLVGLISHVDKLEESIPQKLRVKSTASGSTLELELS